VTTINVNTIAPAGSTLTVGDSGDTIVVPEIKVNTVKDAGGNTLWVSNGSGTLSSVSGFGGALNLLSTQTASGSASISFTSGIDSTYKEYVFKFININPSVDEARFTVNFSSDGGSNYNMVKTTTYFQAYHRETGADGTLAYSAVNDLAESADAQRLSGTVGSDADQNLVGELHIFNPASTTYVKNFYVKTNHVEAADYTMNIFVAGYVNSTSAVNAIQYATSTGNFDGKIKMYGVS
tara:strand:- start:1716 stop:2426 length:711 start_codon:yes stop_codon:yes gene_type:complete